MKKTTTPSAKSAPKAAAKEAGEGADRIAKVIARAGLCSRRDAEVWIADGRVSLNGKTLDSPAVTVKPGDKILVDGQPLPERDRTRLWLFHKPKGTVTTTFDPEGRQTVFDILPEELPRVMTVGRLDINTEGLLLLTNDGGLARVLELPATGWLRRYRVRAHGEIDQLTLDKLKDGVAIDGILYGGVEATLDRKQGDNVWLTVGLREGKNREVKNILAYLGLSVNRLIRLSFGPFQLGDLADGAIEEVPRRVLRAQLGDRLSIESGADFDAREGDREPIQTRMREAEEADGPLRRKPPRAGGRTSRAAEAEPPLRAQTRVPARAAENPRKAPTRSRGEGLDSATRAPREAPNARRDRLTTRSEVEAAPKTGRLSRRPEGEEAEGARTGYKTGKAFEVDRKPREARAPVKTVAPARDRKGDTDAAPRAGHGAPKTGGSRSAGFRTDGPQAGGPKSEGPKSRSPKPTRAEGQRSERPRSDGPRSEGPRADRPKASTRTDGHRSDDSRSGGAKPGGHSAGGPKSGGTRSGGFKSDGPKPGGPKSGGPKSGGPKSGGRNADRRR